MVEVPYISIPPYKFAGPRLVPGGRKILGHHAGKGILVMHLLVITGFLGSGKTTFIVKLVKIAMEKGLKVAIIVNEIGNIIISPARNWDLTVVPNLENSGCFIVPPVLSSSIIYYKHDKNKLFLCKELSLTKICY